MLRVAGEVADGVRLHPFNTKRHIAESCLASITEGLNRTGRARESIDVVAGAFLATGATDEEVAKAVDYVRFRIAFYCSTRAYWNVLRLHGMEDLGEKLRPFPAQGRWDEMAAQIPDDVLHLFAIVGRHEEVADRVAEKYAGLVDSLALFMPPGTDPAPLAAVIQDVQRVETPFTGYVTDWDTSALAS